MKQIFKWSLIISGCLIVIIIAALLLAPRFINVQKYKPQFENLIAQTTGRSFSVGDDLRLSLFPWASLSFSNLTLGNLPGFEEEKFATVGSFDVRVKLIPLLFKDIQIKHLIVKGVRIVLEKRKDGRVSWDFAPPAATAAPSKTGAPKPKPPAEKPVGVGALKSLAVGDVSITDGTVIWIDHLEGRRNQISDVTLQVKDVTLKRPIRLQLAARFDGKPLSVKGSVGPLGKEFGRGPIPLDLSINALEQVETTLQGRVNDPVAKPRFDLQVRIAPFSPRKLLAALKPDFQVVTSDPKALNRAALQAKVIGDPQQVTLSDGLLDMDESKMAFSVTAKEFDKPDIAFDIKLDKIDVDRYLPPPDNKGEASENKGAAKEDQKAPAGRLEQKAVDYTPLRRIVLDGAVRIGKLKIKNAEIEKLNCRISGKKGLFKLDPLSMALYQGAVEGRGSLDVRKDTPAIAVDLSAEGIQAGPLLADVIKKDILEGTLKARSRLKFSGDTPETIKKTVSGDGDLLFRDGAVKGIDLAGMVRNAKAAFGLAEKSAEKPKTDFTELHAPFTIKSGLVNTTGTTLASPLLRVVAAGNANLVSERLDFRVEPKFVATIKGQGDTKTRTGITVPVLVSGTFASPKFQPDLEGMFKSKIEDKLQDLQEKVLGGGEQKDTSESLGEQIKGLFKGLPFGK